MSELVIATRGSQLALAQAQEVAQSLKEQNPGLGVRLDIIKTQGDKILDVPLAKVGGKGLFVKEIEDALLAHRADLAVHSMKDMPAELPPGLILAAVTKREDVRDALVSRAGFDLAGLPRGAKVGTSSLRRQAQLLAQRPDLEVVSVRGNVQTRLRKLDELGLDGIMLAQAGLSRLSLGEDVAPRRILAVTEMLPAVGQGALGLEARADDERTMALVQGLAHEDTAHAVRAERAFLARLEGGCQVPIAGFAEYDSGVVKLSGLVCSLDGSRAVRAAGSAPGAEAQALGRRVAEDVLDQGGREILAQVYGEAPA